MPQEDKIKREIDRIGLVLAKLLSMLLHKDYPDNATVDIATQLRSALDIDLNIFLFLNKGDDIHFLVSERQFSIENLRSLANLIYDLAHKTNNDETRQKLLSKSLNIYEYVSANNHGTMFLDVEYRLKQMK